MAEDMVRVDISTLAYDLNAIMDFIFQNKNKEKSSEIREVYDKDELGDLKLVQKSLVEIKQESLDAASNIRYDFIKYLIEQVNSIIMVDEAEGEEPLEIENEVTSPIITHLGETFALNTLFNEGMLTNIDLKQMIIQNDEQE